MLEMPSIESDFPAFGGVDFNLLFCYESPFPGLLAPPPILLYAYIMTVNVRQTIPDGWATKAYCPLCGSPKMRVEHPRGASDQLLCMACGLVFELEQQGARLHVSQWPASLPFLHIMVADEWRTAAELRSLVKQMISVPVVSAPLPPPSPIQSPQPIPPANVGNTPEIQNFPASSPPADPAQTAPVALDAIAIGIRVKQLRALGNSPKEIRTTLTQAERNPQRVKEILEIVIQMEHREQSRQSKKLAWAFGILIVVVILLVGTGYILQENFLNQNQSVAAGTAGATLQPTQAPNMVVKIMNLNTPVVNYGAVPPGAPISSVSANACPRTAQDAANLFGGKPADWYYPPSSNGWVMAHAGSTSTSIFVPKGMKAAYLQLSNRLELMEVIGPATMTDTYYIAISCP